MTANNRQSHDTDTLSQEQTRNTDSKLQTLDNKQLDQITGGFSLKDGYNEMIEKIKQAKEKIYQVKEKFNQVKEH